MDPELAAELRKIDLWTRKRAHDRAMAAALSGETSPEAKQQRIDDMTTAITARFDSWAGSLLTGLGAPQAEIDTTLGRTNHTPWTNRDEVKKVLLAIDPASPAPTVLAISKAAAGNVFEVALAALAARQAGLIQVGTGKHNGGKLTLTPDGAMLRREAMGDITVSAAQTAPMWNDVDGVASRFAPVDQEKQLAVFQSMQQAGGRPFSALVHQNRSKLSDFDLAVGIAQLLHLGAVAAIGPPRAGAPLYLTNTGKQLAGFASLRHARAAAATELDAGVTA